MIVHSSDLKKIMDAVKPVLRRSTLPILEMIRLQAKDGKITATATTGGEVFISSSIDGDGSMDVCVPTEFLRYLNAIDEEIEITIKNGHLYLTGSGKYKCGIEPGEDFVQTPSYDKEKGVLVNGAELKEVLERVVMATSKFEYSVYSGVMLHNEKVYGADMDSNLAIRVGFDHPFQDTLLSDITVSALIKTIPSDYITVYDEPNKWIADCGDTIVWGKKMEPKGFHVSGIDSIMDKFKADAKISQSEWLSAFDKLSIVDGSNEVLIKSNGVGVELKSEGLTTSSSVTLQSDIPKVSALYNLKDIKRALVNCTEDKVATMVGHPIYFVSEDYTAFCGMLYKNS